MLFSSIPFLFYFLPAVVGLYFLVPGRWRNGLLLITSLLFYAWGEPGYVVLMVASITLYFLYGLAIEHSKSRGAKKLWLTVSVLTGAAMLGVFKYADFAIQNWNALTGMGLPLLRLALPIGISFYTFQCMSYTVDVYRGDTAAQRSLIDFGAYVALFPQLIAGPIVRYVDVARELKDRRTTLDDFSAGLMCFLMGLGKKILIANPLGELTEIFRASQDLSVLFYWIYAAAFMLHIYFDFSGYSDMAIGLGRIFGFRFPRNFDYPYMSGSITEFWRRWHKTLGSWFRDYVYIPLGGNRVGPGRWLLNILVVWMLTGLWHGAAWNFVIWGLLFAALLVAEKWIPAIKRLPGLLRHLYVLLIVAASFVIFNAPTLSQAWEDLKGMFGLLEVPLISGEAVYYLRSFAVLFAVAILGATPLPKRCVEKLQGREYGRIITAILWPLIGAAILLCCTAYLVDGSFNPFLYFRF